VSSTCHERHVFQPTILLKRNRPPPLPTGDGLDHTQTKQWMSCGVLPLFHSTRELRNVSKPPAQQGAGRQLTLAVPKYRPRYNHVEVATCDSISLSLIKQSPIGHHRSKCCVSERLISCPNDSCANRRLSHCTTCSGSRKRNDDGGGHEDEDEI
jgi:hypothetical protein